MKIVVLNGSPKGDLSVTMQYIAYLAKYFPRHDFRVFNIAARINQIENNPAEFEEVIEQVRQADGVIWGFSLYILMVHAHYKRFIELIWERNVQGAFAGKYAAALTTSIHFFDHTAHNYIHAISDDLNMRFVDSFSADMNDLFKKEGQQKLIQFGESYLEAIENHASAQRQYPVIMPSSFVYEPGVPPTPKSSSGKKIVIMHDENDPDHNLSRMVRRCRENFSGEISVINIRELMIKGSCLGCLKCASQYRCTYTGKDDYIEFYKSTVMTADILVYAGSMVDRFWSSRWKMFFDRIFFNTHTPVLTGKQIVILTSGPFSQVPNLTEIFNGFFEFQGANMVGLISDESVESAELDKLIDQSMNRALKAALGRYSHPQSFLGLGGQKIFRDDIYGRLRTVFSADHRAYRRLGFYKTFPQADLPIMLLNTFIAPLVDLPPIRRKFDSMIKTQMVVPLKQVVERLAVSSKN